MRKSINLICAVLIFTMNFSFAGAENIQKTQIKEGDYVELGKYREEPILWQCMFVDEKGSYMFSDKILCYKPLDTKNCFTEAKEDSDYKNTYDFFDVSNYYRDTISKQNFDWEMSSIRTWLNSDSENVVYNSTHKPTVENVYMAVNPYDSEPGFLYEFTESEKRAMSENSIDTMKFSDVSIFRNNEQVYKDGYSSVAYDTLMQIMSKAQKKTTIDKVFLPEIDELLKMLNGNDSIATVPKCFFASPVRNAVKDDIINPDLSKNEDSDYGKYDEWWTRNPVFKAPFCTSYKLAMSDKMCIGIRPAFYFNNNISIIGGNGTKTCPYIIGDDNLSVTLNNQKIHSSKPAVIKDGTTLIELSSFCDAVSAYYYFDGEKNCVTIERGDNSIDIPVQNGQFVVDDMRIDYISDNQYNVPNDDSYVPLRYIAEKLNFSVEWDGINRQIKLVTDDISQNVCSCYENSFIPDFESVVAHDNTTAKLKSLSFWNLKAIRDDTTDVYIATYKYDKDFYNKYIEYLKKVGFKFSKASDNEITYGRDNHFVVICSNSAFLSEIEIDASCKY